MLILDNIVNFNLAPHMTHLDKNWQFYAENAKNEQKKTIFCILRERLGCSSGIIPSQRLKTEI